jgi:hypothetical protein
MTAALRVVPGRQRNLYTVPPMDMAHNMEVSWRIRGTFHGASMEPPWNPHGTLMEPPWNPHGTLMEPSWNPHGTLMEPSWNPHGPPMAHLMAHPMEVSWKYHGASHGSIMEVSWRIHGASHGSIMAYPWRVHGASMEPSMAHPMEPPWNPHGTTMEVSWRIHGSISWKYHGASMAHLMEGRFAPRLAAKLPGSIMAYPWRGALRRKCFAMK